MTTIASSTYTRQRYKDDPKYKIDMRRKVFVYKNLHLGCWSVKQDGLVKMHTTDINLFDCSFRVNAKGRAKVLEEQRKNVHAGISGYIVDTFPTFDKPIYADHSYPADSLKWKRAMYNPYKYASFVRADDDSKPVYWSSSVRMETPKERGDRDRVEYIPCIPSANSC